jgi:uncharacterized ferritin-like protein (DUF455 family)
MELREVAERVLFSTELEEKLTCPELITDTHPGNPHKAPLAPGRPPELHFKSSGSGTSEFPGLHHLHKESERGRLLHFFANHELLATELMALVLLRFPDAPASFRRGVLRTLKDEQLHTRLYLQRMYECGVHFGDLPVSGYFWRSVSPMSSPLDYVVALSLTFEQANLDFCKQFAGGFKVAGDEATARLLERIYRDEIAHVAYGLKWFRRWKNPKLTDWDAFCAQLKFPLSPQRAKGLSLNIEGRRSAGFDSQFVTELNIYSQSKGRTPNVFLFNPFEEGRINHGKTFTPIKHQSLLARDLDNLPQFLCRQDDIVLVRERPSVEFLSFVKQAGFPLPEFIELEKDSAKSISSLAERKLGSLRPWAWGPQAVEWLEPLFASVTGETRNPGQRFSPEIAELYSKGRSAALLRKFLRDRRASRGPQGQESWLCTEHEVGVVVDDIEAALKAIECVRQRGHHRIVAKETLGLAGHNSIRLFEPGLLDAHRRWLSKAVQNGRRVVIEPWLERVSDFSVQLEMTVRELRLCGFTGLVNDLKGQYQGNFAAPNFAKRIPQDVSALFNEPVDIAARLHVLFEEIIALIETELRGADYVGPVGIDSLVYRTAEGFCRLKPIVEINPRYTMGRLTVELMKRVCPGSHGLLRLVNKAQLAGSGFGSFLELAGSFSRRFPLKLEGQPLAKIFEGALCLNDPACAQVCLAVFQVSRESLRQFSESRSFLSPA